MPGLDRRHFFSRLLRDPRHIGAIAPSGRALAQAMAAQVDHSRDGHVVELGPGTGPVTRALLDSGLAPERLVLIERDQALHHLLQQRFPDLRVVHGDAANLRLLLQNEAVEQVSAIVSSLPLLALPLRVQAEIFRQGFQVMPDGLFIQFTYSPAAPVSPEHRRRFGITAERAATVWRNLPPATVWRFRPAPAFIEE